METPADVLVYFDSLTGEAKRGRLLTIWPQGFYEVNLQLGGAWRRSLLPISRTFILAAEPELEREPLIELER
jgi:hypothetical protein